MARPTNKVTAPSLELIVWANVIKWKTIRGVTDEELAALLGVANLYDRNKSYYLKTSEMGKICNYFGIEPEKLLER